MDADAERAEPNPDDVDVQFARIVAGYHAEVTDRPPIEPTELTDLSAFSGLTPRGPDREDEPSLLDGLDTFGADLPDDEGHFVPPPPPPLPRPTRRTVVAVLSLIAGVAVLFWPELLPIEGSLARILGFAGIVTGAVVLVMGLRPGDEEDDDPEGGAVV